MALWTRAQVHSALFKMNGRAKTISWHLHRAPTDKTAAGLLGRGEASTDPTLLSFLSISLSSQLRSTLLLGNAPSVGRLSWRRPHQLFLIPFYSPLHSFFFFKLPFQHLGLSTQCDRRGSRRREKGEWWSNIDKSFCWVLGQMALTDGMCALSSALESTFCVHHF